MPIASKFDKLELHFGAPKINIWKTLYINLRVLPFSEAVKFPIIIYGKFKIKKIGLIKIESSKIQKGLIRIGVAGNKAQGPNRIENHGTLIFRGRCDIWGGALLELGPRSILDIGEHTLIGENVRFMLRKKCLIGKFARIAFDSQFMDSDFHYMLNTNTGEVRNCTSEIIIGNYNWIGNRTTVKKGAITPDYTIVAAPNAMLNKDYRKITDPMPILGGSPAKQISCGWRRIYDINNEIKITEHFSNHQESFFYDLKDIDTFCCETPHP